MVRAVDPVVSFHIQGPAPNDHVSIGLQQVSFDLQGMAVQVDDPAGINDHIPFDSEGIAVEVHNLGSISRVQG